MPLLRPHDPSRYGCPARARATAYATALCLLCGTAAPGRQPSSEMGRAVEEFNAQTRLLEASASGARGAARRTVAFHEFHGRVYEYFRNDFLDAVPHEVSSAAATSRCCGATAPDAAGRGDVFHLDVRGRAGDIAGASLLTVSIPEERTGNYAGVVDAAMAFYPAPNVSAGRMTLGKR